MAAFHVYERKNRLTCEIRFFSCFTSSNSQIYFLLLVKRYWIWCKDRKYLGLKSGGKLLLSDFRWWLAGRAQAKFSVLLLNSFQFIVLNTKEIKASSLHFRYCAEACN